jgi:hypothetical protein
MTRHAAEKVATEAAHSVVCALSDLIADDEEQRMAGLRLRAGDHPRRTVRCRGVGRLRGTCGTGVGTAIRGRGRLTHGLPAPACLTAVEAWTLSCNLSVTNVVLLGATWCHLNARKAKQIA